MFYKKYFLFECLSCTHPNEWWRSWYWTALAERCTTPGITELCCLGVSAITTLSHPGGLARPQALGGTNCLGGERPEWGILHATVLCLSCLSTDESCGRSSDCLRHTLIFILFHGRRTDHRYFFIRHAQASVDPDVTKGTKVRDQFAWYWTNRSLQAERNSHRVAKASVFTIVNNVVNST
jgi:hypothetical protein